MEKNIIHLSNDTICTIKEYMPENKTFNNLAYFYSIFCDSTRLKILISLLISEMCVNDLSNMLNINQTTISHQLKILKSYGVVSSVRKNKFVFYHISNKFVNNIMVNGVDYLLNKRLA